MSCRDNHGRLLPASTWDSIRRIIESEIENTRDRGEPSHPIYYTRHPNENSRWASSRARGRTRGTIQFGRGGNRYHSERGCESIVQDDSRFGRRHGRGLCRYHGRGQVKNLIYILCV